ncbi:MAG: 1,4-dihydroxy-2-naphthoate octaprenyltransferase [Ignavibacteriales bacterium]
MSSPALSPFQIWMAAARPKTLAAAFVPVAVGSSIAFRFDSFKLSSSVIALLVALLIQIGTNFTNDLYDFLKGADTKKRVGPLRVMNAGLVSEPQMRRAIYIVFGAAFLLGMILVVQTSWWLLAIGIFSIFAGLAYTAGPYPLAYNGLGDIFVFIFFGLVATVGTFYVNTETVTLASVIASVPVGLLITNILVVNNYRDADQDKTAGKRTTAVLFGKGFAKFQFVISFVLAFAVPFWIYTFGYAGYGMFFMLFLLVPAVIIIKGFLTRQGAELNKTLENTAKFTAAYGLTYSLGFLL